jgi:hypothetical protein
MSAKEFQTKIGHTSTGTVSSRKHSSSSDSDSRTGTGTAQKLTKNKSQVPEKKPGIKNSLCNRNDVRKSPRKDTRGRSKISDQSKESHRKRTHTGSSDSCQRGGASKKSAALEKSLTARKSRKPEEFAVPSAAAKSAKCNRRDDAPPAVSSRSSKSSRSTQSACSGRLK